MIWPHRETFDEVKAGHPRLGRIDRIEFNLPKWIILEPQLALLTKPECRNSTNWLTLNLFDTYFKKDPIVMMVYIYIYLYYAFFLFN